LHSQLQVLLLKVGLSAGQESSVNAAGQMQEQLPSSRVYFWAAEMLQFSALRRQSQAQVSTESMKVELPQSGEALHSQAQTLGLPLNLACPWHYGEMSQVQLQA